MQQIIRQRNAADDFSAGDTIETQLTDGRNITFIIAAVNHYAESEIILVPKNFLASMSMNDEWSNEGGWKDSRAREKMNEEIFSLYPEELRKIITPVERKQVIDGEIITCTDSLWLPSEFEVFGKWIYGTGTEDDKQFPYYGERRNRIKEYLDGAYDWEWLASPVASNTTNFCGVSLYGNSNYDIASSLYGVAPACAIR
jgi:hypothetical protein